MAVPSSAPITAHASAVPVPAVTTVTTARAVISIYNRKNLESSKLQIYSSLYITLQTHILLKTKAHEFFYRRFNVASCNSLFMI